MTVSVLSRLALHGAICCSVCANRAAAQFAELSQPRHLPPRTAYVQHPPGAADLDGDGDLDLIAAATSAYSGALIWRNDGFGVFTDVTAASMPPVQSQTFAVAAGDLDGDGDVDLVMPSLWADPVFLNDGQGRFTAAAGPPYFAPGTVHLFDADGDGDLDILDRDGAAQPPIRLWRNDGRARFTLDLTSLPSSAFAVLAVLDVEGDGDIDVLVNVRGMASVWINDGSGRFTDVPGRLNAEVSVTVAGDVDGDGDIDLVILNRLFLNDGQGRFTDESAVRLPASVTGAQRTPYLADVDADGDLDLLCARGTEFLLCHNGGRGFFADVTATHVLPAAPGSVQLLFADFDGDRAADLLAFDFPARYYAAEPGGILRSEDPPEVGALQTARSLAMGDIDGDGDADLVVGVGLFYWPFGGENLLLRSDGLGRFSRAPGTLPSPSQDTRRVRLVDLDRDGDLDILEANAPFVYWHGPYGGADYVHWNDGRGGFSAVPLAFTMQDASNDIAAADLDGDGDLDVMVANEPSGTDSGQNRLYVNHGGTQGFSDATGRLPVDGDATMAIVLGDVDGDGDVDAICSNAGQDRLYLNDGWSNFTDGTAGRLPVENDAPPGGLLHDLDGDGDLDLMLGGRWLLLNDGRGFFTDVSASHMPPASFGRDHWAVDVDDDGDPDVIVGGGGVTRLLLNHGGHFTAAPASRFPPPLVSVAAAIGDIDVDGDRDLVWTDGRLLTTFHNLTRHAHAPGLRLRGQPYALQFAARAGFALSPQKVVPFLAADLASPLALPAWGTFRLQLHPLVQLPALVVPAPAGVVVLDLSMPRELDHVRLYLQALVLHAPGPDTWRFSNVLHLRR